MRCIWGTGRGTAGARGVCSSQAHGLRPAPTGAPTPSPRAADRKWGSPYLTRGFFTQLGARMADRVLLVLAETAEGPPGSGEPVAGALNLIGSHALFGRNWGCKYGDRLQHLHFEVRPLLGGGPVPPALSFCWPRFIATRCACRHPSASAVCLPHPHPLCTAALLLPGAGVCHRAGAAPRGGGGPGGAQDAGGWRRHLRE